MNVVEMINDLGVRVLEYEKAKALNKEDPAAYPLPPMPYTEEDIRAAIEALGKERLEQAIAATTPKEKKPKGKAAVAKTITPDVDISDLI